MNPSYRPTPSGAIVYDPDLLSQPDPAVFTRAYWEQRGALSGEAGGRGRVYFVASDAGPWALRHYRRGGMAARLTRDRYLWTGLRHTRAWCEWHLLYDAHQRGLPVPRPVAARVERRGCGYRADIITQRLPGEPLAARLSQGPQPPATWRAIGLTLGRLHRAGLRHADLNAHNILISGEQEVMVVDLDRGRLQRRPGRWCRRNLARLHRSLEKLRSQRPAFAFTPAEWALLEGAYAEATGALRHTRRDTRADGA